MLRGEMVIGEFLMIVSYTCIIKINDSLECIDVMTGKLVENRGITCNKQTYRTIKYISIMKNTVENKLNINKILFLVLY